MIDPHIIEQVRLWSIPGILLGILGIASRHYLLSRKASLEDRRLTVEAEAGIRDDYAVAVRGFREEISALKEEHRNEFAKLKESHRLDMDEMRHRHAECDTDREKLREKVSALRDYASGLYRIILQNSASGVLALGDMPDHIKDAAARVDRLFKGDSSSGSSSGQDSDGASATRAKRQARPK